MWEAALEVRLEFGRAAAHVPGAVFLLGGEQVMNAALNNGISGVKRSGFDERVDCLAGSVGIAFQIAGLSPAAIRLLFRGESAREWNRAGIAGPFQTEDLHYGIFAIVMTGGGAFYCVYLLKAGVPLPAVLAAMAAILGTRFVVRPIVVPLAVRIGLLQVQGARCCAADLS